MTGQKRLSKVISSTPRMAKALPGLPMDGTKMVRLIRISGAGVSDFFEPVFRDLALSEHSFHILCLLVASDQGSAAPSELSDMIGTSRSNMTRLVQELAEAGWVERSVAPRDARRQVISITDLGREKVSGAVGHVAEPIYRAFSGLSAEEFTQLEKLLHKLILSLDQEVGYDQAAS